MKNLFGRLIGFLSPLWSWANFQVNKNVHTAVKVVQIIKDIIQSPVLDILLAVEQRIAPDPNVVKKYDKIKAIVEEWLPKISLQLNLIHTISEKATVQEQLKAILAELSLSSKPQMNEFYKEFCAQVLVELEDGLDLAGAIRLTQLYYSKVNVSGK